MNKKLFIFSSILFTIAIFSGAFFNPQKTKAAEVNCILNTLSVKAVDEKEGEPISPIEASGSFPLGTNFIFSGQLTGSDCPESAQGFPGETAIRLVSLNPAGVVNENIALFNAIPEPDADGNYNFSYTLPGNSAGQRQYGILFASPEFFYLTPDQLTLSQGITTESIGSAILITFKIADGDEGPAASDPSTRMFSCGQRIAGVKREDKEETLTCPQDNTRRCCPTACGGAKQLRIDNLPHDVERPPDDGDGNPLYYWVCGYDASLVPPITPIPTPPLQPCQKPDGTVENCETAIGPIKVDPQEFISVLFGILLSLAGGIALLIIIWTGYKMMMSRGNPEKIEEAKEQLTSAIIGLLFIIFSVVILEVIGVDILAIPGFGEQAPDRPTCGEVGATRCSEEESLEKFQNFDGCRGGLTEVQGKCDELDCGGLNQKACDYKYQDREINRKGCNPEFPNNENINGVCGLRPGG